MVLPTPPSNPNTPIQNNPFYYAPETSYLQGPFFPATINSSSGLTINPDGTIIVTGGGGGGAGVGQIIGAPGISVSPATGTGTVTISNTGVLTITAGAGLFVSGSSGNFTISVASGVGSVTNVIGVPPVTVVTGATTPVISIATASLTGSGVTQLVNNSATNDSTKALTAAQGFALQQQISSLAVASNLTLAGTLNASTGQLLTVTGAGSSAAPPFVVGSILPIPSLSNKDYFVIATTPGTYSPPGGGGPLTVNQGDWLLSNGTIWQHLTVGFQATNASPSTAGVVRLATTAETQAGTNAAIAVTPAGACQTYIPRSLITTKGDLIAGFGSTTPGTVPIGTTGQVLTVDPSTSSGVKWTNIPTTGGTVTFVGNGNALVGGPITTTGSLDLKIQALTPNTYTNANLTVNCYGIVTSVSNGILGIPASCIIGKGSLITGTGPSSPTALPVGLDGYVLASCAASSNGLCWVPQGGGAGPSSGIPCSCITAKGTIIAGSATNLPGSLTVGSDGQVLRACAGCALGVTWAAGCPGTVTNVVGTTPISVATGTTIPVVSIATASTTAPGATQLIDNVTTNDNTKALTAAQGYALQQQLSSFAVATNLTLAGTLNATTGLLLTNTSDGFSAGFTVGSALPAPAVGNKDYFVIATTGGTYNPPGGGGPFTVTQGDWFLSNGSVYQYLDVGPAIPTSSSGSAGIVQLATSAQTIAGTDSTLAVTPAGAAAAYIPLSKLTGQGALAVGTATSTAGTLGIGTSGQVLTVDLSCTQGVKWNTPTTGTVTSITVGSGLTGGTITSSGSIALATTGVVAGSYTYPTLSVDGFGRILTAANGCAPVLCCTVTVKGDLLAASAPNTVTRLGAGADGQLLVACSACTTGLTWVAPAAASSAIPCACLTQKGVLITASTPGTPTALTVGTDGQALVADSTCALGMRWCSLPTGTGTVTSITAGAGLAGGTITNTGTISIPNSGVSAGSYNYANITVNAQGIITAASSNPASIACSVVTSKGDILAAAGPSNVCRVAVGVNGQVLAANSACSAGVEWINVTQNAIPCACITGKGALVTGTGASAPVALPVGSDGQVLVACNACTSGLTWGAATGGTVTNVSGLGAISVATGTTTPVISVAAGTTSVVGVVQLVDNLTSNDSAKALTAAQGCSLQQQINALSFSSNITLAGTLNGATGNVATVTTQGTAAGFNVGSALPSPAAGNNEYYVLITTPGSVTPPGGGGPYTVTQGDWLLSNGTVWQFIDAGFNPVAATTTTAGIVRLATNAETQTGTDNTIANTPAGAAATYIKCTALTNKGAILSATGVNTPSALPVGTDGQMLVACSTASTGLCWVTNAGSVAIPCSVLSAKGSLVAASGSSTPANLAVGSDGQTLVACSSAPLGLCWTSSPPSSSIPCACITGKGALISGSAINTPTALSVGADSQVLTACSACPSGLTWASLGTIGGFVPTCCYTNKGTLVVGGSVNNPVPLPAAGDGLFLSTCAACSTGVLWANAVTCVNTGTGLTGGPITGSGTICIANTGIAPGTYSFGSFTVNAQGQITAATQGCAPVLCCTVTTLGDLIVGTGNATVSRLGAGAAGTVLMACSLCPGGLFWSSINVPGAATPTAAGTVLGCTTASNTALGCNALVANTTGTNNVSVGLNAGCSNTTGCSNVYIGQNAGCAVDSCFNVVIGAIALCSGPSSALAVTAVGAGALRAATGGGGQCSTAIGVNAGCQVTSGVLNTFLGAVAGGNITTGNCNVIIGNNVNAASATGSCQLAIGFSPTDNWLTGNSTKAIKPGAGIIDCAGVCGSAGQVLMSNGSNAICWGTISGTVAATPTVRGTILGCTESLIRTAAIGCCALVNNTGLENTAIGWFAGFGNLGGASNIYVGTCAGSQNLTGCNNIAIGVCSNTCALASCDNITVGNRSLTCLSSGNCNIAIGSCAMCNLQVGSRNVAIGSCVQVPNSTAGCQLAIGYDNNALWLTGCSDLSIRPGAGVRDCANSTGTPRQVLTSTGSNGVVWRPAGNDYWLAMIGLDDFTSGGSLIERWVQRSTNTTGFSISNSAFGVCDTITVPTGVWKFEAGGSPKRDNPAAADVCIVPVDGVSGTYINTINTVLLACTTSSYSMTGVFTSSAGSCTLALRVDTGRLNHTCNFESMMFTRLG